MSKLSKPTTSRRGFIKTAAASAPIMGLGTAASQVAHAQNWGEVDSNLYNKAPVKVLEINLLGAPSPWETLWVTKNANGSPNYQGMDHLMNQVDFACPANGLNVPDVTQISDAVGSKDGETVHLGAAAKPIWNLIDRMRLVVQKHDEPQIAVHEIATPYALTGTRVGDPRHTGPGVPIARRNTILKSQQLAPHSYVIGTRVANSNSYFGRASVAMGQHSGPFRPLFFEMESAQQLVDKLDRPNTSTRRDALLRALRSDYSDQLLFRAVNGSLVRSASFDGYSNALDSLFNAPNLQSILPSNLTTVGQSTLCVNNTDGTSLGSFDNPVGAAVNLARDLLTRNTDSASHVLVADTGIRNLQGGGQPCYDTHGSLVGSDFESVQSPLSNLYNLFVALADAIDPTGQDPNKINLDDTMIVLNTEFGRKIVPERRGDPGEEKLGREHESRGYVGMLIGGPITMANNGTAGWLSSNDGLPVDQWFSPSDFRGAVLLAAGVNPFSPEIFGTTNFGPHINIHDTEEQNTMVLANRILGV